MGSLFGGSGLVRDRDAQCKDRFALELWRKWVRFVNFGSDNGGRGGFVLFFPARRRGHFGTCGDLERRPGARAGGAAGCIIANECWEAPINPPFKLG